MQHKRGERRKGSIFEFEWRRSAKKGGREQIDGKGVENNGERKCEHIREEKQEYKANQMILE